MAFTTSSSSAVVMLVIAAAALLCVLPSPTLSVSVDVKRGFAQPATFLDASSPQLRKRDDPANIVQAVKDHIGDNNGNQTLSKSGDGTYYTKGSGSCGMTELENAHVEVCALSAADLGQPTYSAPNCGKCVLVCFTGTSVCKKFWALDFCTGCAPGSVDLNESALPDIPGFNLKDKGRFPITWTFTPC